VNLVFEDSNVEMEYLNLETVKIEMMEMIQLETAEIIPVRLNQAGNEMDQVQVVET